MSAELNPPTRRGRRYRTIRWWICGLLFASTVINYLDRQSLALLAPDMKKLFSWDNDDYANLVIGFRVAYTIGQFLSGRFLDRVGTRKGATITVAFYSAASILTPLANGLRSFFSFRCLGMPRSIVRTLYNLIISFNWFESSY